MSYASNFSRLSKHTLETFLKSSFLLVATSSIVAASDQSPESSGRVVVADIVAMDQLIVYNRFGSFDPYGMIYALKRDVDQVVPASAENEGSGPDPFPDARSCQEKLGTEAGQGALQPGKVRLKACKRPRPLVLRANVGDILDLTFTNLLRGDQPTVSGTFCGTQQGMNANPEMRDQRRAASKLCETQEDGAEAGAPATDWPRTRRLSLSMPGLEPVPIGNQAIDRACTGLNAVEPGQSFRCRFRLTAEGTHLFSNPASPSGGEGDGGSLTHGLFGAVIVEPAGSKAYRSQISKKAFDELWARADKIDPETGKAIPHARKDDVRYDFTVAGTANEDAMRAPAVVKAAPCAQPADIPLVAMHRDCGKTDGTDVVEVVHGDLNAVVVPPAGKPEDEGKLEGETARPFREFTVIFHDELKTYYTNAFKELGELGPLSGIRDGFGINYGASGVGSLVVANRKKIGPAADCTECLYEEFFLESWANGDPALLETFPDDPSNVHHSYLNDRIVFRNFHAGPKETHVFHLHSHQWFAGNDWNRGSYLDSQTIGPQQGFSYWIYQGGTDRYRKDHPNGDAKLGYWAALGAGNRNRTPGDAIFHCHLYPHFAQGMWELWRVHDVLEDGSRTLPDGQKAARLSLAPEQDAERRERRPGTDLTTGPKLAADGKPTYEEGTPIPGIVPVPDQPAPLLPTYGDKGMPGYPFYVAGKAGRRAPQAPLDIARNKEAGGRDYLDGGLPRHIIDNATKLETEETPKTIAEAVAVGDFTAKFDQIDLTLLPYDGTPEEKRAMAFHHNGNGLKLFTAQGEAAAYDAAPAGRAIGYASNQIGRDGAVGAKNAASPFIVNGAPAKPGAPFADPCGAPDALAGIELPGPQPARKVWSGADPFLAGSAAFTADPALAGFRRFDVSAVQLDMTVNSAGWHDPQARINVLSETADKWKNVARRDGRSGSAEPFFFRAFSGECIEFRHTNELPKDLELDDFQMKVPTDTIGQHIHLVKFDVTSSDGSANGFNYEDGTFAPDEILARLCGAQRGTINLDQAGGANIDMAGREALCDSLRTDPESVKVWKEKRSEKPLWFQTTVQRWFADPILSPTGETRAPDGSTAAYAAPYADRTMRTVFSHDHFGPSNIQQHGFYSALLIEPADKTACVYSSPQVHRDDASDGDLPPRSDTDRCVKIARDDAGKPILHEGSAASDGVGSLARVFREGQDASNDPYHPDFREFALAIADFALLYDGHTQGAEALDLTSSRADGLDRLAGEALGTNLSDDAEMEPGESAPARHPDTRQDWIRQQGDALVAKARHIREEHGRPVYPPVRPEAISQRHHDPYLVNYRTEPVPLRVGATSRNGGPLLAGPCGDLSSAANRTFNHRQLRYQAGAARGDMANVFRSAVHGDPCTPVLDAYAGERMIFRLIQGAQEVQHLFTVEGRPFRRNADQMYPYGARWEDRSKGPSRWRACVEKARDALPSKYFDWLYDPGYTGEPDYWRRQAALLAECDNIDGYTTAQEIGISEHFEMAGPMSRFGPYFPEFTPDRDVMASGSSELVARAALQGVDLPRDSLFHFGTSDAIWNGAWGLVRVYPSEWNRDATACQASGGEGCDAPIGARLARLLPPGAQPESQTERNGLAVDVPKSPRNLVCPAGAEQVFQAVAAVEARNVLISPLSGAEGMLYNSRPDGNALYDPDGLMFVALSPSDLRLVDGASRIPLSQDAILNQAPFSDPDDATMTRKPVDWTSLKTALRLRLRTTGPQPLVMRIKAGQCLNLVVVNALTETAGHGRKAGLLDRPGDATMPKIVPLNVDRDSSGDDLVPSASLALAIPIPMLSAADDMPNPVGLNPLPALPPMATRNPDRTLLGENRWRAPWTSMTLYGGRINAPEDHLADALRTLTVTVTDDAGTAYALSFRPLSDPNAPAQCGENDYIYSVFGQPFCLSAKEGGQDVKISDLWTANRNAGFAAALQEKILEHLNDPAKPVIKTFPYAFGTLPIKSIADPIGHGVHGLNGTLIVEPKGAALPSGLASSAPMLDFSLAAVADPSDASRTLLPAAEIKERALLWQDGLNLWDRKAPTLGFYGLRGRPLPDCTICDDSYDRGERGVSYRSEPFFFRLRKTSPLGNRLGPNENDPNYSSSSNLSAQRIPPNFFASDYAPIATPAIDAPVGSEVWARIVAAQGRARQHAFVATGAGYQDLYPGFGSGHSSLIASGKTASPAMLAPENPLCAMWFDGPRHLMAGGAWGLMCAR